MLLEKYNKEDTVYAMDILGVPLRSRKPPPQTHSGSGYPLQVLPRYTQAIRTRAIGVRAFRFYPSRRLQP